MAEGNGNGNGGAERAVNSLLSLIVARFVIPSLVIIIGSIGTMVLTDLRDNVKQTQILTNENNIRTQVAIQQIIGIRDTTEAEIKEIARRLELIERKLASQ